MPHQCTTCGNVFADGSKEMLGGCPDCGNNTFQFHAGEVPEEGDATEAAPDPPGESAGSRVARAADTVREFVASDDPEWPDWPGERDDGARGAGAGDGVETDDADIIEAPAEPGAEDRAQADARTEVADAGDLDDAASDAVPAGDTTGETADGTAGVDTAAGDDAPVAGDDTPPDPDRGRVVSEPAEEDSARETDIATLRAELDEQFESIRIVEPGQYELNLMELYDRQEYIIALQEDGRYVIEVPDSWEGPDGGN